MACNGRKRHAAARGRAQVSSTPPKYARSRALARNLGPSPPSPPACPHRRRCTAASPTILSIGAHAHRRPPRAPCARAVLAGYAQRRLQGHLVAAVNMMSNVLDGACRLEEAESHMCGLGLHNVSRRAFAAGRCGPPRTVPLCIDGRREGHFHVSHFYWAEEKCRDARFFALCVAYVMCGALP